MIAPVLALDPGPQATGWVLFHPSQQTPILGGHTPNHELLGSLLGLPWPDGTRLACENLSPSATGALGDDVLLTAQWIGRFTQAWESRGLTPVYLIAPRDVKLTLLGTTRVTPSQVRAELIARVGEPGKKASPGPTYYLKGSHMWSALAVAQALLDLEEQHQMPPAGTRGTRTDRPKKAAR